MNELNGKMGISAPYKSVPVMKLIKVHNPKSKEELVELIKWHYENECECGIKSQGTVESFGQNLFDAQTKYWGEERFSLQECIQWEYHLFVVQSLKGGIIERKAINLLNQLLKDFVFIETGGYVDEELRIDVIVLKNNQEVGGIQIKPGTFKLMRSEVIAFNSTANRKWGKPVFYLYYNEKEEFTNLEQFEDELINWKNK